MVERSRRSRDQKNESLPGGRPVTQNLATVLSGPMPEPISCLRVPFHPATCSTLFRLASRNVAMQVRIVCLNSPPPSISLRACPLIRPKSDRRSAHDICPPASGGSQRRAIPVGTVFLGMVVNGVHFMNWTPSPLPPGSGRCVGRAHKAIRPKARWPKQTIQFDRDR